MRTVDDGMSSLVDRAIELDDAIQALSVSLGLDGGEIIVHVGIGGVLQNIELTPNARHVSPRHLPDLITETYRKAAEVDSLQRQFTGPGFDPVDGTLKSDLVRNFGDEKATTFADANQKFNNYWQHFSDKVPGPAPNLRPNVGTIPDPAHEFVHRMAKLEMGLPGDVARAFTREEASALKGGAAAYGKHHDDEPQR